MRRLQRNYQGLCEEEKLELCRRILLCVGGVDHNRVLDRLRSRRLCRCFC